MFVYVSVRVYMCECMCVYSCLNVCMITLSVIEFQSLSAIGAQHQILVIVSSLSPTNKQIITINCEIL